MRYFPGYRVWDPGPRTSPDEMRMNDTLRLVEDSARYGGEGGDILPLRQDASLDTLLGSLRREPHVGSGRDSFRGRMCRRGRFPLTSRPADRHPGRRGQSTSFPQVTLKSRRRRRHRTLSEGLLFVESETAVLVLSV